MSGKGIDGVPIRWPARYDPAFFERLFRETLSLGDARNAIEGPGITVTGGPDEPATISTSADIDDLLAASILTADPSDLDNGRTLIGEAGVLELVDNGPGVTATMRIETHGISLAKIAEVPSFSALATQLGDGSFSTLDVVQSTVDDTILRRVDDGGASVIDWGQLTVDMAPDNLWTFAKLQQGGALSVVGVAGNAQANLDEITAGSNDTVLRRTSDTLDFGALTVDMAPDSVWTYAKIQDVSTDARILGLESGAPAPMQELTLSQVLDLIGAAAQGDILYRGAAGWQRLPAGTDGQVLTLSGGEPVWADPDSLLQSTFLTSADDTGTLTNSRQVLGGTGITLDAGTPGQLTIDNDNP